VIFYASPVIIPLTRFIQFLEEENLSVTYLHLYMLNPLAVVFQQFRHAMITHATPSAGQALGGWAALVWPLLIVVAALVLGFWVFNRSARHIAENL
jgi:ABC-type polysaccharide/polyol phosphate export permease